jgi:hypothetical protein
LAVTMLASGSREAEAVAGTEEAKVVGTSN